MTAVFHSIPASIPVQVPAQPPLPNSSVPLIQGGIPVCPPRQFPLNPQLVIAADGSSVAQPTVPIPDVEQDIHNVSFESESDPLVPPKWSKYRRMLEFIFTKFPQSRGENPLSRQSRSEFE